MSTIVVGYDGSEHAERALDRAIQLARRAQAPGVGRRLDTSRDGDYTDYEAVRRFAVEFADSLDQNRLGLRMGQLGSHPFDVDGVVERLSAGNGGYEVVHASPGLEIGVYVLVAPEPDRQQPHEDDEVYLVLQGRGTLEVEGGAYPLREGHAVFVPAGAEHRFTGYEANLAVLVVFDKSKR